LTAARAAAENRATLGDRGKPIRNAKGAAPLAAPAAPADASRQPTTIGGYALAIAKALDHYGVDSRRILQAAGIPLSIGNDPMVRLPVSTLTRLYQMCVGVTHDPYFGLTVARFIQVSQLHALGYALAASSTLLDFCKRLERYFRIASQTAAPSLSISGNEVTLRMQLLAAVSGETQDAFIGFVILLMRQLHKPAFNPLRVAFAHPCPREGSEPYEKLFRAPVTFGEPDVRLVFEKAEMEQPLAGACAELAQINDNVATQYLARLDKSDVIARVREKIIEFLPGGECSRDKVAEKLCMSPSKLHLKLTQRNTSFHAILDDTRKELACAYLQQAARSVTEVAFLLGFTDSSNFTRAFKRWTGRSPSDFREPEPAAQ
jgi:AraC-like DNA-binding protein